MFSFLLSSHNTQLFRILNSFNSNLSDSFWVSMTTLGDGLLLGIILGMFIIVNPRITVFGLILILSSSVAVNAIKSVLPELRPAAALANVHVVEAARDGEELRSDRLQVARGVPGGLPLVEGVGRVEVVGPEEPRLLLEERSPQPLEHRVVRVQLGGPRRHRAPDRLRLDPGTGGTSRAGRGGRSPRSPAGSASCRADLSRSRMNRPSSRCESIHDWGRGPAHCSMFVSSCHAEKAGPTRNARISSSLIPKRRSVASQTASCPVVASGIVIPCSAIQSISRSQRARSHHDIV